MKTCVKSPKSKNPQLLRTFFQTERNRFEMLLRGILPVQLAFEQFNGFSADLLNILRNVGHTGQFGIVKGYELDPVQ